MVPTKEQELKAVEKIKKILAELGNDPENSYVCCALDGCIEDAEDNIEDDAAYSWKERAESAKRKLENAETDREYFRQEAQRQSEHTETAEKQLTEAKKACTDLYNKQVELMDRNSELEEQLKAQELEIMKLKAKLYDLLVKE
jgi:thiamine biosynthesis lipoprotein ApbE